MVGGGLERMGGTAEKRLLAAPRDELQAERQALGEAAGQRDRGMTRQVEGDGAHRRPDPLFAVEGREGQGRGQGCGREEEIAARRGAVHLGDEPGLGLAGEREVRLGQDGAEGEALQRRAAIALLGACDQGACLAKASAWRITEAAASSVG